MGEIFQVAGMFMNLAGIAGLVFVVILHAILAQALASDVDQLHERGRKPYFLDAGGWAFAALVLGLVTVAFYWVIHYSTLRDAGQDRSLKGR